MKTITNIAMVIGDPSTTLRGQQQDGRFQRLYVTLRLVGCCDMSNEHRIRGIHLEYLSFEDVLREPSPQAVPLGHNNNNNNNNRQSSGSRSLPHLMENVIVESPVPNSHQQQQLPRQRQTVRNAAGRPVVTISAEDDDDVEADRRTPVSRFHDARHHNNEPQHQSFYRPQRLVDQYTGVDPSPNGTADVVCKPPLCTMLPQMSVHPSSMYSTGGYGFERPVSPHRMISDCGGLSSKPIRDSRLCCGCTQRSGDRRSTAVVIHGSSTGNVPQHPHPTTSIGKNAAFVSHSYQDTDEMPPVIRVLTSTVRAMMTARQSSIFVPLQCLIRPDRPQLTTVYHSSRKRPSNMTRESK